MLTAIAGSMLTVAALVFSLTLSTISQRGPVKYRDMLLDVGTEEISHSEMLSTAVALNLDGALLSVSKAASKQNGVVRAVLGGMSSRSFRWVGQSLDGKGRSG